MSDPLFVDAAVYAVLYLAAAVVVLGVLILVLEDISLRTVVRTWWRR